MKLRGAVIGLVAILGIVSTAYATEVQDKSNEEFKDVLIYQYDNGLSVSNGLKLSDSIEISYTCIDEKYDMFNGHPADGINYTEDVDDTAFTKPLFGYKLTCKRGTSISLKEGDIVNVRVALRKIGETEEYIVDKQIKIKNDIEIK